MGIQLGFYAARKHDVGVVMEWAEELGFGVLPMWPRNLSPTPARDYRLGTDESKVYFVPLSLASRILTDPAVSGRGRHAIDEEHSPVIEFRPSYRSEGKLWPGRIYLGTRRTAASYKDIHSAYQALARRLKQWPLATDGRHVGPKAAELASASKLRLGEVTTNAWQAADERPKKARSSASKTRGRRG